MQFFFFENAASQKMSFCPVSRWDKRHFVHAAAQSRVAMDTEITRQRWSVWKSKGIKNTAGYF